MLKTNITDDERAILVSFNRKSPILLVRLKAQAVLSSDQSLSSNSIALVTGKGIRAIERWLSNWDKQRMASIFSGHASNSNAAKLTREQQAQIKEVLSQPPSDYGIPKALWDVPTLKVYVSAQFNVIYESDESYTFNVGTTKMVGMGNNYSHLSYEDRVKIELLYSQGSSFRLIAKTLGRSPNTISYELKHLKVSSEYL